MPREVLGLQTSWIILRLSALVTAAISFCAATTAGLALDVEFATRPVKRDILALYDSRHEPKPDETRIHRLAEMPLNWLGFKITYQDVNAQLPSPEDVQRYRGVVTWFVEPLATPVKILSFLDAVTALGVKYACLGDVAPPEPPGTEAAVGRILGRLGLKPTQQFVTVTHRTKITIENRDMVGFERPVDKALPEFRVLESGSPGATIHLAVRLPQEEGETTAVLVATSPGGAYAADSYTIYYDATANRARWILNPFAFFKAAYVPERFPVPDVTTLNGRRMYFSHIDGDGWNNISEIEGYKEAQTTASEVILKEIIAAYPDLPVSVGLIAGDTDTEIGGTKAAGEIARKIFALSQVEVASHTYTHPFEWQTFENYDREAELRAIEKAAHPTVSLVDRMRSLFQRVAGGANGEANNPAIVAGSADLPRGYLKLPFEIHKEVQGALDRSSSYAPQGKTAAIYLWSGDAVPFEAAIKATRDAGVRNMNGGDNRLDANYPSVFYVPPIARPVGAERQIYAGNSNENTYTNNWHGPFYGLMALTETLKNTEEPRRLKPFNLYYHMYSGEKPSSLAALKSIVELARSSPVIPITASTYAGIADDYFGTAVEQAGTDSWTVSHRGTLQTLRLDDAADIDIDDLKSSGVLGARRLNGSLYVALDPAVEPALIAVRPVGQTPLLENGSARLVESRWQIRSFKKETCGFSFEAQGFGRGEMIWQAPALQGYDISVARGNSSLLSSRGETSADGLLLTDIVVDAQDPVQVRFTCR